MKRLLNTLFVFAFGAAMTLTAVAQENKTGTPQDKNPNGTAMSSKKSSGESGAMTMADKTFVKKAAEGGLAEVELGKLATEKASTDQVKKFGQRMVDDHSKANDQLKDVAAQKHIDLPTEPSAKDKATKARLEKLSGEEFDRAYMRDMVKDHKADVAEFARESQSSKDPAVKNFARQTLPTLREHLKEAEKLAPQQKTTAQNNGMKHNSAQ
jgi:putative membrane protein